jgi:hypothetical protein
MAVRMVETKLFMANVKAAMVLKNHRILERMAFPGNNTMEHAVLMVIILMLY